MIDMLYKVVRKVIVPQYPWIKDFVWIKNTIDGDDYYALEIIVDKDFYWSIRDAYHRKSMHHGIYTKLYNDAKMLFSIVGPEDNMFFDDVIIGT